MSVVSERSLESWTPRLVVLQKYLDECYRGAVARAHLAESHARIRIASRGPKLPVLAAGKDN